MKIIVFGGTGWLGHSIVLDLIRGGYDVTICSRGRKSTFLEKVSSVKTVSADKSDEAAMKEILSARYDVVIDTVPNLKSIELISRYAAGVKHYIHCSRRAAMRRFPLSHAMKRRPTAVLKALPAGRRRLTTTTPRSLFSQASDFP